MGGFLVDRDKPVNRGSAGNENKEKQKGRNGVSKEYHIGELIWNTLEVGKVFEIAAANTKRCGLANRLVRLSKKNGVDKRYSFSVINKDIYKEGSKALFTIEKYYIIYRIC